MSLEFEKELLVSELDMTFNSTSRWDDLRKHARSYENELDTKLVAFAKLGNSFAQDMERDAAPLLTGDNIFDTMSVEIENILANLTSANDEMADLLGSVNTTASMRHICQRHRDILQDYTQEYCKTKSNIQAFKDREELLGSVHQVNSFKNGLNNRKQDFFLKENDNIMGADGVTNDTISIAIATKENLYSQRGGLSGISNKMNAISNKFPMIGSLMNKINVRSRRDSIIMAAVITGCLIALFLFA